MDKKSRSKATHARKSPPPPVDPLDAVHAAATTPAWLVATRDDAVAVKLLETLERAVAKLPRTPANTRAHGRREKPALRLGEGQRLRVREY